MTTTTETTALVAVPEYTETAKALAELRTRMANVVHNVTTTQGMTAAKKDVAELRGLWVALEDRRKEIKAPALERCRLIDAEAKTLEAELKALAEPIKAQIEAEEQRKEREKAEREQAERDRVAAINALFDTIKAQPLLAVNATAEQIQSLIAGAEAFDMTGIPDDMQAAAVFENRRAIASLRAALDSRMAADAEAAKIAADRAELEKLRRVAAEQQAELDRQAEAKRQQEAEAARKAEEAAQAERAAAEAAQRAEREAKEEAERQERAAQQEREDAERKARQAQEDAERAATAEQLRRKAQEVADKESRLESERRAAENLARQQAIDTATLREAATAAVELLQAEGYGDHLATQALAAALAREA